MIKVKYIQKAFHQTCGDKLYMLDDLIKSSISLPELQHEQLPLCPQQGSKSKNQPLSNPLSH